jgi:hypothetical protein
MPEPTPWGSVRERGLGRARGRDVADLGDRDLVLFNGRKIGGQDGLGREGQGREGREKRDAHEWGLHFFPFMPGHGFGNVTAGSRMRGGFFLVAQVRREYMALFMVDDVAVRSFPCFLAPFRPPAADRRARGPGLAFRRIRGRPGIAPGPLTDTSSARSAPWTRPQPIPTRARRVVMDRGASASWDEACAAAPGLDGPRRGDLFRRFPIDPLGWGTRAKRCMSSRPAAPCPGCPRSSPDDGRRCFSLDGVFFFLTEESE